MWTNAIIQQVTCIIAETEKGNMDYLTIAGVIIITFNANIIKTNGFQLIVFLQHRHLRYIILVTIQSFSVKLMQYI